MHETHTGAPASLGLGHKALKQNMYSQFDSGVVLMSLCLSVSLSLCLFQDERLAIYEILMELESQCLSEISAMLNGEIPEEDLGDLFFDCVDAEIKFYQ